MMSSRIFVEAWKDKEQFFDRFEKESEGKLCSCNEKRPESFTVCILETNSFKKITMDFGYRDKSEELSEKSLLQVYQKQILLES